MLLRSASHQTVRIDTAPENTPSQKKNTRKASAPKDGPALPSKETIQAQRTPTTSLLAERLKRQMLEAGSETSFKRARVEVAASGKTDPTAFPHLVPRQYHPEDDLLFWLRDPEDPSKVHPAYADPTDPERRRVSRNVRLKSLEFHEDYIDELEEFYRQSCTERFTPARFIKCQESLLNDIRDYHLAICNSERPAALDRTHVREITEEDMTSDLPLERNLIDEKGVFVSRCFTPDQALTFLDEYGGIPFDSVEELDVHARKIGVSQKEIDSYLMSAPGTEPGRMRYLSGLLRPGRGALVNTAVTELLPEERIGDLAHRQYITDKSRINCFYMPMISQWTDASGKPRTEIGRPLIGFNLKAGQQILGDYGDAYIENEFDAQPPAPPKVLSDASKLNLAEASSATPTATPDGKRTPWQRTAAPVRGQPAAPSDFMTQRRQLVHLLNEHYKDSKALLNLTFNKLRNTSWYKATPQIVDAYHSLWKSTVPKTPDKDAGIVLLSRNGNRLTGANKIDSAIQTASNVHASAADNALAPDWHVHRNVAIVALAPHFNEDQKFHINLGHLTTDALAKRMKSLPDPVQAIVNNWLTDRKGMPAQGAGVVKKLVFLTEFGQQMGTEDVRRTANAALQVGASRQPGPPGWLERRKGLMKAIAPLLPQETRYRGMSLMTFGTLPRIDPRNSDARNAIDTWRADWEQMRGRQPENNDRVFITEASNEIKTNNMKQLGQRDGF